MCFSRPCRLTKAIDTKSLVAPQSTRQRARCPCTTASTRKRTPACGPTDAFATVNDVPRYPLDGATALEQHLRALTGRTNLVVPPAELHVVGADATAASAAQWAVIRQLQSRGHLADPLQNHRDDLRVQPFLPAQPVGKIRVRVEGTGQAGYTRFQ